MHKIKAAFFILVITILISTVTVFASDAKTNLIDANKLLLKSIESIKIGDIDNVRNTFDTYKKYWLQTEDSAKDKIKSGDNEGALADMNAFKDSWID